MKKDNYISRMLFIQNSASFSLILWSVNDLRGLREEFGTSYTRGFPKGKETLRGSAGCQL